MLNNQTYTNLKRQTNFQDLLKFLAIILMIGDHLGCFFLPKSILLRVCGRPGIAVFCFFAGYNFKRVNIKLLIYGLILTTGLLILQQHFQISILIGFFIFQVVFSYLQDNDTLLLIGFVISVFLSITCTACNLFEYNFMPLSMMICGIRAKKHKPFKAMLFIAIWTAFLFTQKIFQFSSGYLLLKIVLYLGIYYLLAECKLDKVIKWPFLSISRYLLEIYFWHLSIFILIRSIIN